MTGVKPLSGGIQSWRLKRLERLINEFPGFPTLFFGLESELTATQLLLSALGVGRFLFEPVAILPELPMFCAVSGAGTGGKKPQAIADWPASSALAPTPWV